jgi:hypothetical protein
MKKEERRLRMQKLCRPAWREWRRLDRERERERERVREGGAVEEGRGKERRGEERLACLDARRAREE